MKRRIRTTLLTTLVVGLAGLATVTTDAVAGGTRTDDTGWGAAALTGAYDTGWGAPAAGAGTNDTGWG
ncbi:MULTISPECIES: hypothetical protein [Streptomyces]|jgi:hypothetical protein|uniref:Uncharacterized protein n=1 Tax=Streptomyces nymphaeiformis TaxID=2663842 RepID=A0A7W7XC51_9ACTN|nr:hypothetical protein [Streptomyces nymphaeiformis]MBB4982036.1 hypothetical protein [Streptomyces nymphaeiformis]